jgi:hypothetical protein
MIYAAPLCALLVLVLTAFPAPGGDSAEARRLGEPQSPSPTLRPEAAPRGIQILNPPAAAGSLGPELSRVGKNVLLSWLEPPRASSKPQDGVYALRYSIFDGRRWAQPQTVFSGNRFFANWADFPSIAEGPGGWLLAHWAQMSGDGTYAYDVRLARADSPGSSWRQIGKVHDDETQTEHGFVSFVPDGKQIRVFWLDGRDTKSESGASEHGEGNMSLRTALAGETVRLGELLDTRVCDCCQTGAAMTSEGPIVVYRDRSEKEIRDIAVVRRTGKQWTKPRSVASDGWEISGCPVNGPSVDADGRRVAVAWFTAAQGRPRVQVAFSKDSGATFDAPRVVDDANPLGRVAVVLDANGDAIVLWVASQGKKCSLQLRRFSSSGRAGESILVSETSAARTSGFPRLTRSGDNLVVAWVEASEPSQIRAATLAAAALR